MNSDATRDVTLPGNTAQVHDLVNNDQGQVTDESDGQRDGRIHLVVSPNPIYVEIVQ